MNSVSDAEIDFQVRKYRRGMVTSLLPYLILACAEKGRMCGYDVISLVHERFRVLLSPGQVYPVIDRMTNQGLISKERRGRSVLLEASSMGLSLLKAWRDEFRVIEVQLGNPMAERIRGVV